eukprot:COSAG03_NODE_10_length_23829_cov_21.731395_12_plen_213_part_00
MYSITLLGVQLRCISRAALCCILLLGIFGTWFMHGYFEERLSHGEKFPMELLTLIQFSSVVRQPPFPAPRPAIQPRLPSLLSACCSGSIVSDEQRPGAAARGSISSRIGKPRPHRDRRSLLLGVRGAGVDSLLGLRVFVLLWSPCALPPPLLLLLLLLLLLPLLLLLLLPPLLLLLLLLLLPLPLPLPLLLLWAGSSSSAVPQSCHCLSPPR